MGLPQSASGAITTTGRFYFLRFLPADRIAAAMACFWGLPDLTISRMLDRITL